MGRRLFGTVIGEIPGKTDEIVVIGGHLDSWDLGTGRSMMVPALVLPSAQQNDPRPE